MKDDLTPRLQPARQTHGGTWQTPTLTLGFIPLTDCAVLAVARELGFARREGIDLCLSREVSWANIRDKVALGHLHGAQMLAGMPIAASLGINQIPMPMLVPFCLNRNGNAVTVSNDLYEAMAARSDLAGDLAGGVAAVGAALRRVVAERRSAGLPSLTFGMVYPFSCHNYELRYWMAACGIDPDADVRLVVIPPPLMVDSLRDGLVDGFCVGEPWNSLAIDAGLGRIIVSTSELWHHGTEKVLAVPQAWAAENERTLAALIRVLHRAAAWADEPSHRGELAAVLASPSYLDTPADVVARALAGEITTAPGVAPRSIPDFLVLHRDAANLPSVTDALWIYSQMRRWGQVGRRPGDEALIRATVRPDLYRAALAEERLQEPAPAPGAGFFDGRPFDPGDIDGYLGR